MNGLEARLSKHDREINALRTLVKSGMRLILRIEQAQLRIEQSQLQNDRQITRLLASQQATEKQIRSLLKNG